MTAIIMGTISCDQGVVNKTTMRAPHQIYDDYKQGTLDIMSFCAFIVPISQ